MSQRMGVGALIFNEEQKILLMYRTEQCDFYKNCWFLPCGRTEDGEEPTKAIVREVKEETSLEIQVMQEIYNKVNEKGIPEIAYLCEVINGVAKNMEPEKCKALDYFSLNNLPDNTGKRTLEIIEVYKESK